MKQQDKHSGWMFVIATGTIAAIVANIIITGEAPKALSWIDFFSPEKQSTSAAAADLYPTSQIGIAGESSIPEEQNNDASEIESNNSELVINENKYTMSGSEITSVEEITIKLSIRRWSLLVKLASMSCKYSRQQKHHRKRLQGR